MVFKRSTPITALDLDSSDLPDASASLKGGVTLAGSRAGLTNFPRMVPLGPPSSTFALSSKTVTAEMSRLWVPMSDR
jgi:hypothetical protein